MADTAYALIADVGALFHTSEYTPGTTPEPTNAQVQKWLNQFAARLDAVLREVGFSAIPATDANDLLAINPYLAGRVAYEVWHVVMAGEEIPPRVLKWIEEWNTWLEMLLEKETGLPSQSSSAKIKTIQAQVYGADANNNVIEDWLRWQGEW